MSSVSDIQRSTCTMYFSLKCLHLIVQYFFVTTIFKSPHSFSYFLIPSPPYMGRHQCPVRLTCAGPLGSRSFEPSISFPSVHPSRPPPLLLLHSSPTYFCLMLQKCSRLHCNTTTSSQPPLTFTITISTPDPYFICFCKSAKDKGALNCTAMQPSIPHPNGPLTIRIILKVSLLFYSKFISN